MVRGILPVVLHLFAENCFHMIVTNPKIIKSSVSENGKVWLTLASVVLHELEDGIVFIGQSSDGIGLLQAYGTEEINGDVVPNQKYFKQGSTLKGDFKFGALIEKLVDKETGKPFMHSVEPVTG